MNNKLKYIIFCFFLVVSVACSYFDRREGESERIGPNVPASLVIYFKGGASEEQIDNFYRNQLFARRADGRGEDHKFGIRSDFRLLPSQANGHDAIAVTFHENVSEEDRRKARASFESSEVVYKVFENIAPKDIQDIE